MPDSDLPDTVDEQPVAHDKGPLLGQQVAGSAHYDPALLFPVPRANARGAGPGAGFAGFGEDIWHAYELSWLDPRAMPQMYLGTLTVPASSPNLIESKSLKLYFNSLNSHIFKNPAAARQTIEADLSTVAGAGAVLSLHAVDDGVFAAQDLAGFCLDALSVAPCKAPDVETLQPRSGDDRVYTHLMRSLCPVTAQPDWATLIVESRGSSAERSSLLEYLLAYRNHQEFHEQCVERIFADLMNTLHPTYLSVQALYTRRGGLDICPWRCSQDLPAPRWRINRQ